MANALAIRKKAFVAVDFGTTFSGVAWALIDDPDRHHVINNWPQNKDGSFDGMTSDKVPSELAYTYGESVPGSFWGFQIEDAMPRIQWLKLGLASDQKHKISLIFSETYDDRRKGPIPQHSSPEQAVTDYLRHLREHTIEILRLHISRSLEAKYLQFAFTVPAIWSEKAKVATLNCAQKAGFGQASELSIISEPEAAAIHALSNPHKLQVGDAVVLLDAGGGTCDLITFSILEIRPTLRLKEAAPGDGSLCGSSFLNRRFEKFLEERLSSVPGWGRDSLEDAMQRSEWVAKRKFAGDVRSNTMIPVPGVPDNQVLGVSRGRLRVTGEEMAQIFLPVLEEVRSLVKGQVRTSRKQIKTIILVGGFGQSPYLRKYLRDSFAPNIELFAPVDGWTAVVRGALRKTLGDSSPLAPQTLIESRMARSKRYWSDFHGHYRIDVMSWFVTKKGHRIEETRPIVTKWRKRKLVRDGAFDAIRTTIYELDTATEALYFNRHMKEHAIFKPSLDQLQKSRIPISSGADFELYYKISYEIHAFYHSAHCRYELWYEGKKQGSVQVEYV